MKVLWFTNTPANSDESFNKQLASTGGWLKALDKALQDKVDLYIVFYHNLLSCKSFQYGKTKYYPIPQYKNLYSKLKVLIKNDIIDAEHLDIYLKQINEIKPDIIHIHGTENPFGCIVNHTEIPVIISIQGCLTGILNKYCSGIENRYLNIKNSNMADLKTLMLPYAFKDSRNKFIKMQKREEKNLRYCKYIIGRTYWDRRITRVLAPKSRYFHNDEALRDNFYHAIWTHHNKDNITLHTTNSNSYYKGFETICLTLYELNKLGIDCEWRVAGIKSSDLIVKVVKNKIKSKYPKSNLKLLGNLPQQDIIAKLLEADIYVMASHIENSPNSLCEAMIMGMPCIATFAGGTGALLKDGYEGLLIQDGDPWAMAGAILEMKENTKRAVAMGQNARKRAMARHNKEKIVKELLEIYNKVINDEGSQRT